MYTCCVTTNRSDAYLVLGERASGLVGEGVVGLEQCSTVTATHQQQRIVPTCSRRLCVK